MFCECRKYTFNQQDFAASDARLTSFVQKERVLCGTEQKEVFLVFDCELLFYMSQGPV